MLIIEAGYTAYGPRILGRLTGYRHETVYRYARDLGIRCQSNAITPPTTPPHALLVVLAELGLGASL